VCHAHLAIRAILQTRSLSSLTCSLCSVCIRVLDKIVALVPKEDAKNLDKIDTVLNEFCEQHKDGEERRVCYSYV
jgi:hypothetical protein